MTRVAIDTNILVYAEGLGEGAKVDRAIDVIAQLNPVTTLIPVQVLGELTRVLVKKGGLTLGNTKLSISHWSDTFLVAPSSQQSLLLALELAAEHSFSIWDALIMAVAQENSCRFLLTEDLQHGFRWAGIEVVNPFITERLPF